MLNPETAQTMTVRELAAALDGQMREFGYAESSLKTYRGICAKIVRYIASCCRRFPVVAGDGAWQLCIHQKPATCRAEWLLPVSSVQKSRICASVPADSHYSEKGRSQKMRGAYFNRSCCGNIETARSLHAHWQAGFCAFNTAV